MRRRGFLGAILGALTLPLLKLTGRASATERNIDIAKGRLEIIVPWGGSISTLHKLSQRTGKVIASEFIGMPSGSLRFLGARSADPSYVSLLFGIREASEPVSELEGCLIVSGGLSVESIANARITGPFRVVKTWSLERGESVEFPAGWKVDQSA